MCCRGRWGVSRPPEMAGMQPLQAVCRHLHLREGGVVCRGVGKSPLCTQNVRPLRDNHYLINKGVFTVFKWSPWRSNMHDLVASSSVVATYWILKTECFVILPSYSVCRYFPPSLVSSFLVILPSLLYLVSLCIHFCVCFPVLYWLTSVLFQAPFSSAAFFFCVFPFKVKQWPWSSEKCKRHCGLCVRGPSSSVDMKGSFWGNKNTKILIFRELNTDKNILMNIFFTWFDSLYFGNFFVLFPGMILSNIYAV